MIFLQAANAYMIFMHKHRANIVANNPGMSSQAVTKALAEMWSKVSQEEKDACEADAAKDRVRYEEEAQHYKPLREKELEELYEVSSSA